MTLERKIRPAEFIAAGALLLVLAVSLLLYLVFSPPRARRVLFFPSVAGKGLTGEERWLPARQGIEENVQVLVDEIILGPARPEHQRLLPRKTRLASVLRREGVLYLDLSQEILLPDGENRTPPSEMIQAVADTVLYNFPRVHRLVIFLDGQVPRFAEDSGGQIRFAPSLLR